MPALDHIRRYHDELTAIRHDLHIHPELGMEEHRTSALVAEKLESWGIEVHRGVGGTGVVGVLRNGTGNRAIGLRADMDALPINELNDLPYKSQTPGVMHACGHDGHTTMLLGAAKYLAETKNFSGTVNFIFQPGEEGCGGALAMLEDGLFDRFPCDAIYGMHNAPGIELGKYAIRPGASAAGGAFFDIVVHGKGAHGARPEASIDPVLIASHITAALQSIVARNITPKEMAVVSVTKMIAGDAYNVIPEVVTLSGTARFFSRAVAEQIENAMRRLAEGIAAGFGATATLDWRFIFAPTINDPERTRDIADAAAGIVGDEHVDRDREPGMGSEDFSFMMEKVPGAYILVGNGPGYTPHNPRYNFNDETTPYGAALYAEVVERGLPK
ncbi:amidohydrolase [Acetobacteraceae bacterium H6797]|nr:amidohydrolase [Acetobacteraceae bacterium H6797]